MASHTKIAKAKRANKRRMAGRKRKRRLAQKSTLSAEELFSPREEPNDPEKKR